MKVVNDLLGYDNLKIIQDTNYFSFSLDSVLLPKFVSINKGCKNVLDVGTGNVPIPLILSKNKSLSINAIELQKEIYNIAMETLKINELDKRINLINDDFNNIGKHFERDYFDLILSNPPYFKCNNMSKRNKNDIKSIARHEIYLNINQLVEISFKYLKNKGKLALIYRTDRLNEVLSVMEKNRIVPKRLLFVFPKINTKSNLFLVEGVKNANPGIFEVKHLIVHNDDGSYTDEVLKFFK